MMFGIDSDWVSILWEAVKNVVRKKQDIITGQTGQVVGFQAGKPTAQDMECLLSRVWPNGPYTFEINENGQLIAHYAGIKEGSICPVADGGE